MAQTNFPEKLLKSFRFMLKMSTEGSQCLSIEVVPQHHFKTILGTMFQKCSVRIVLYFPFAMIVPNLNPEYL